ncbi:MAG: hypothetical protein KF745_15180 [Phycisphaeraceae bacterium]|nr:hypothetical protein [Phycisphaeraceae bacterium]
MLDDGISPHENEHACGSTCKEARFEVRGNEGTLFRAFPAWYDACHRAW